MVWAGAQAPWGDAEASLQPGEVLGFGGPQQQPSETYQEVAERRQHQAIYMSCTAGERNTVVRSWNIGTASCSTVGIIKHWDRAVRGYELSIFGDFRRPKWSHLNLMLTQLLGRRLDYVNSPGTFKEHWFFLTLTIAVYFTSTSYSPVLKGWQL